MLLTRKETIIPTITELTILQHMGYAAYKLWNVGNYEKKHYEKLGLESYPNWYNQKKRLKDHFFYKNLPSQTAQDVLQQLEEGWKSYFKLLKTGGIEYPKPPKFKHDIMSFTFLKDAIHQSGNIIRLSISKQLKEYLKTQGINEHYLYLKIKRFSNIVIRELQVQFKKNKLILLAVYEKPEIPLKNDNGHYLGIDLGVNNAFTCYDSDGNSFIVNGFLNATHWYDKRIAHLQSISDAQQAAKGIKYPKKSKQVLKLYERKQEKVKDFLHQATAYITKYCIEHNIHTVIIGDMKNIRKDANLKRSNQQLHSFPFQKIYQMLSYKLKLNGIQMIKQKEAYSSQCSPNSKKVSRMYAKKSQRVERGLYKEHQNIYNADSVGAYNILRLYLNKVKYEIPMHQGLSNPIKVTV